jgi:hypothetical protein
MMNWKGWVGRGGGLLLRYYPWNRLERLRKTTKKSLRIAGRRCLKSNLGPPEHETGVLTRPRRSVFVPVTKTTDIEVRWSGRFWGLGWIKVAKNRIASTLRTACLKSSLRTSMSYAYGEYTDTASDVLKSNTVRNKTNGPVTRSKLQSENLIKAAAWRNKRDKISERVSKKQDEWVWRGFIWLLSCSKKVSKAVPLHAMEALGGRGIAPTHLRPRH